MKLDCRNGRHAALARMILAERDIKNALGSLKLLRERVTAQHDPLFTPLEHAGVISYSRPFSGPHKVSSRYEQFDDNVFTQLHTGLLSYRNEIVAHSDEKVQSVVVIPSGGTISWDGGSGIIAIGQRIESPSLTFEVLPFFEKLCECQIDRLAEHILSERSALLAAVNPEQHQGQNGSREVVQTNRH
jgi:hypothetical protein